MLSGEKESEDVVREKTRVCEVNDEGKKQERDQ